MEAHESKHKEITWASSAYASNQCSMIFNTIDMTHKQKKRLSFGCFNKKFCFVSYLHMKYFY